MMQIPGPFFLGGIFLLSLSGIMILFIRWNRCSSQESLGEHPDPMHIAYLVGGVEHLIRTGVFSLWQKGIVAFETKDKKKYISCKSFIEKTNNQSETIIRDHLISEKPFKEFIKDTALIKRLEAFHQTTKDSWMQKGLLFSGEQLWQRKLEFILFYIIIMILGCYKIYLGIHNDKPVLFLIGFIVLFNIIMFLFSRKNSNLTACGKRSVNQAKRNLEWLKERVTAASTEHQRSDPALPLAVALFGAGILLAGGSFFAPITDLYGAKERGGCSSGGCGGGCSSSGCGSSGCSGGGCGGCGGGGD